MYTGEYCKKEENYCSLIAETLKLNLPLSQECCMLLTSFDIMVVEWLSSKGEKNIIFCCKIAKY